MSQKTDHTAVLPTSPAWTDYVTLIKPRVNLLVLVTTVIGFHLGNLRGTDLPLLFNTVVGTFLVASGAAAFNQLLERDVDAKMRRTMQRPLPDGRIGSVEAFWFATALSAIGLTQLWFGANQLHAAQEGHLAGHGGRRGPGRVAPGHRLGSSTRRPVDRGLGAVCDRLLLADAARAGHLVAVP